MRIATTLLAIVLAVVMAATAGLAIQRTLDGVLTDHMTISTE